MRTPYLQIDIISQYYINSSKSNQLQIFVEEYDHHIKSIKNLISNILNKVKIIIEKSDYLIKFNILSYDLKSFYATLLHKKISRAVTASYIHISNDQNESIQSHEKKLNKIHEYLLRSVSNKCKSKLKNNLTKFVNLSFFSLNIISILVINFPFLLDSNSKKRGNKK